MNKRIQRKRTKGWRMPPNTVYVGRPGKFGNPFLTAAEYEKWLKGEGVYSRSEYYSPLSMTRRWILKHIPDLRGHDLACWCPLDHPCHADVLLRLANQ
jgi:hypothetical protein